MKNKNITIKDIAEAVNISLSTVSRALNNHPKISQSTKEKVWNAAKNLGYQPNLPAYMKVDKNRMICLLLPVLNSQFYIDVVESVQNKAKEKGYSLYIAYTNNDPEMEKAYTHSLINMNIEGVIAVIFDKSTPIDHLNQFVKYNIPTVFINNSDQEQFGSTVIPDVSLGTYKAVNHLFSMKSKRILLFAGDPKNPFYADMIEGYKNAFADADEKYIKDHVITKAFENNELVDYLDKLYSESELPDGIISSGNSLSNQIIDWLKSKGLSTPEDLLLISFSNHKNEAANPSQLTSIHFSGTEIGNKAITELFRMIENKKIENNTLIIPSKFIIKSSTLKIK